jgi:uncharacterized membrane protein (UPF0136 family)
MTMKKIVLTFGLIAGAVMSAMFLITMPLHEEIGNTAGMVLGYATMIAAFLLIFFGVRQYRDRVAGGVVGFGQAAKVGALIALVASLFYVATWEVIYFGGFAPNYLENYQAKEIEKARAAGKSQAEIDKEIAEQKVWRERYKNPAINAAITFLEPLPVALIMVVLSASVLRRNQSVATTS